MLKQGNAYALDRERALAGALRDVATELRLIDASDFIAFIRTEQFANIRNLVSSSTEMYFKPGTIRFGQSADAVVSWNEAPRVFLDLEFKHLGVNVFFRLVLEASRPAVDLTFISFDSSRGDPEENTRRLIEALEDARLPSRQRAADAYDLQTSP